MARANKAKQAKQTNAQIRVSRSAVAKVLAGRVVKGVVATVLAVGIVYCVVAAMLVRVVPSVSGTGPQVVKNITYPGGLIPPGRLIMVDVAKQAGTDPLSRLKQAFVPSASYALVETTAGPTGKLMWAAPDILTIDGKPAPAPYPATTSGESPLRKHEKIDYLKGEYAGVCISGACESGSMIIVDKENILGAVVDLASVKAGGL